jgi:hypothetical protein
LQARPMLLPMTWITSALALSDVLSIGHPTTLVMRPVSQEIENDEIIWC